MWTRIVGWFSIGWVAPLVAALAAGAFVFVIQGWRYNAKIVAMEKENVESVLAFQRAARKTEFDWSVKIQEAQNEAKKREASARISAAGARSAANKLRDALAEARRQLPGDSGSACLSRVDTYADVLGRCTERYRGLAEVCDRHVSDKQTLIQAWPK